MRPYHPNNLGLQPYAHWRVIVLAWAGKLLGIQFKVAGIPYGAEYRPDLWPAVDCGSDSAGNASGAAFRVDREGNCMKPERKVVLRAKGPLRAAHDVKS